MKKKIAGLIMLSVVSGAFASGNNDFSIPKGEIAYQACPDTNGGLPILKTEPSKSCVYYNKSSNPKNPNMRALVTVSSPDSSTYEMQTFIAKCDEKKLSVGQAVTVTDDEVKKNGKVADEKLQQTTIATIKEVPVKVGTRAGAVYSELCGK